MSYCAQLSHFGAIKFTGPEAEKYLQGQITSDITLITEDKVQLSCQCDSKGKTHSTFYIVKNQEDYLLVGYKDSLKLSLAAFRKFAVFSQVTIADISEQVAFYGLDDAGLADLAFKIGTPTAPLELTAVDSFRIFKVQDATSRYLLMDFASDSKIEASGNSVAWQIEDIKAGIPHLTENASGEFVPQMLNLQAIDAISFTKGCYMGQETVARAKYLGKNKRAGYILQGQCETAPKASDVIEMQLGENWRRGGAIANLIWDETEKTVWIYGVLPNDIELDVNLRLKSLPQSTLNIQPLPYSLDE